LMNVQPCLFAKCQKPDKAMSELGGGGSGDVEEIIAQSFEVL